jgi:hypothetical protein
MIGLDDVIKLGNINSLLKIYNESRLWAKLYDKRDDSKFPLWTCHLYAVTFQQSTGWIAYLVIQSSLQYGPALYTVFTQ